MAAKASPQAAAEGGAARSEADGVSRRIATGAGRVDSSSHSLGGVGGGRGGVRTAPPGNSTASRRLQREERTLVHTGRVFVLLVRATALASAGSIHILSQPPAGA